MAKIESKMGMKMGSGPAVKGDQAGPVSRPGPMGMKKSSGNPKLPMCDEPGDVKWSPIANSGPSGNTKLDPSEAPQPTKYGSRAMSSKVPGLAEGVSDNADALLKHHTPSLKPLGKSKVESPYADMGKSGKKGK